MSYAGQHPDVVRDRVLAVALVSTSPGGAEMTEFGLGTTVGRVVGSFGPGVLTRLSRHAGPIGVLRKMGRGVQDAVSSAGRSTPRSAPTSSTSSAR